jgi:hypothetical protein
VARGCHNEDAIEVVRGGGGQARENRDSSQQSSYSAAVPAKCAANRIKETHTCIFGTGGPVASVVHRPQAALEEVVDDGFDSAFVSDFDASAGLSADFTALARPLLRLSVA